LTFSHFHTIYLPPSAAFLQTVIFALSLLYLPKNKYVAMLTVVWD